MRTKIDGKTLVTVLEDAAYTNAIVGITLCILAITGPFLWWITS